MGFIEYNANPVANYVEDCTIRAIATVTNTDWEYTYLGVCTQGFIMHNMPHANVVWGEYLYKQGFRKGNNVMFAKKKNAIFGRYPCCDMVNNAIRHIADGRPENAIEELYQALQKADGYLHKDLVDTVAEAHKHV